jgi:hypothetical protein
MICLPACPHLPLGDLLMVVRSEIEEKGVLDGY